jgi:hypothetical protein
MRVGHNKLAHHVSLEYIIRREGLMFCGFFADNRCLPGALHEEGGLLCVMGMHCLFIPSLDMFCAVIFNRRPWLGISSGGL